MSSFGFSCSANGRSFAALRTSTVSATSSTVPVFSLSLTDTRLRIVPVTRRQYSLPISPATANAAALSRSITTWARPS